MTWPPVPQPPCPCETCGGNPCLATVPKKCPPSDRCGECTTREWATGAGPLPPVPESSYPPGATELPAVKRPGPFRRILNATRRTT